MGNFSSAFQLIGIPSEFNLMVLTVAFVLTLAPYLAGVNLGVLTVPWLRAGPARFMKIAGPTILLGISFCFVPLRSSLLAQTAYKQALDFLNSPNSNHRLAAVRFFSSSGKYSRSVSSSR